MTLKELSQLYYLRPEIEYLKSKIDKLRTTAESTSVALSAMPSSGRISDRVGSTGVDIVYYQVKLEQAQAKSIEELAKLEEYINSITDSFIRQIFRLRFEECRQWEDVADRLNTTSYSVKHACYRYLHRSEKLAHMAHNSMIE